MYLSGCGVEIVSWAGIEARELSGCEMLARLFLKGRGFTELAAAVGKSPNTVRTIIQRVLKKRNPSVYSAGLRVGEYKNYRTPPVDYLRSKRHDFGL